MSDDAIQDDAPDDYAHPVTQGRPSSRRSTKGNRSEQNKRWRAKHRHSRAAYMRLYRAAKAAAPCYAEEV